MSTKEGRIVASKAPSRIRQMTSPVKFLAAPVHAVTMDQLIMLNLQRGQQRRVYYSITITGKPG
jgi:hypothetical protein